MKHLKRWLVRKGDDQSIPQSIEQAQRIIRRTIEDLRELRNLIPEDEYAVRLVVDTNAIIDNPDLAAYTGEIGVKYVTHAS